MDRLIGNRHFLQRDMLYCEYISFIHLNILVNRIPDHGHWTKSLLNFTWRDQCGWSQNETEQGMNVDWLDFKCILNLHMGWQDGAVGTSVSYEAR